jgi:hypothetical protein
MGKRVRNCLSKLKVEQLSYICVLFTASCSYIKKCVRDREGCEVRISVLTPPLSIQNVINTPHIQNKSLFL